MKWRKPSIGSLLILLVFSTLVSCAVAQIASTTTVETSVEDFNYDGLKDVRFSTKKGEINVPGVQVNLFFGNLSDVPLITGETNDEGILTYYSMPSGTYTWNALDESQSNGNITIPTSELRLSESEALVWQSIALSWMGEAEDAGYAFLGNLAKFVGFNSKENPLPSTADSTLLEYSQQIYEWLDKLQTYIVDLDRPEFSIFSRMIFPFKTVYAGFFEDSSLGIDFDQIQTMSFGIDGTSGESLITYSFSLFSNDGVVANHELLQVSATEESSKTMAFPIEIIFGAFQQFHQSGFLNTATVWVSNVTIEIEEGKPLSEFIGALEMANSIINGTISFLNEASSIINSIMEITEVEVLLDVSDLLSGMVTSMQQFTAITYLLLTILKWGSKYSGLNEFMTRLVNMDPELLTDMAMLVISIIGFSIVWGLTLQTVLAVTGIGLLLLPIFWFFNYLNAQSQWNEQLKELRASLGNVTTNLLRMHKELVNINATLRRENAENFVEAANLMAKYAEIAYQDPTNIDNYQIFDATSSSFKFQSIKETELANTIENATDTLDKLLYNYLHWSSSSGSINAYLIGYNLTNVQSTLINKECQAIVRIKNGTFYLYDRSYINTTMDNLDYYYYNKTMLYSGAVWAWDPPVQSIPWLGDAQYAVFYNVNETNPIQFVTKNGENFSNLDTQLTRLKDPPEYYYQYKFYFDDPQPDDPYNDVDLVNDWLSAQNETSAELQEDLRRVESALEIRPPMYELITSVIGSGSVATFGTSYSEGTEVNAIASPSSGWIFSHWLLDSVNVGGSNPYPIIMNENHSLTAVFTEIPKPTIEYDLAISISGQGTTDPAIGTHTYTDGSAVSVSAFTSSGWSFDHWTLDSINVGSTNPYSVTMNTDHTLTAVFTEEFGETSFETVSHNVIVGTRTYVIGTCSNSTISDLVFNQALSRIRFNVDGTTGTSGLSNVTIPQELMSGYFSIYIDDVLLVENVDYTETYNGTHYLFSITYDHSNHLIEIIATNVIPEFTSLIILPLLGLVTTVLIIYRKKLTKNEHSARMIKNVLH